MSKKEEEALPIWEVRITMLSGYTYLISYIGKERTVGAAWRRIIVHAEDEIGAFVAAAKIMQDLGFSVREWGVNKEGAS